MRLIFLTTLLLSLAACHQLTPLEKTQRQLSGGWLLVSPEAESSDAGFAKIVRDSITRVTGLKLVYFGKDGSFWQADSFAHPGKWMINDNIELLLQHAGAGLEPFHGSIDVVDKGVLQIRKRASLGGAKGVIRWTLKKIDQDIFDSKRNQWRVPPATPESDPAVRSRVVAMLEFYRDYFRLVEKKLDYFIPARIDLPMKFYAGGIGLTVFDSTGTFARYFHSADEAQSGYYLLDAALDAIQSYPEDDNYVLGYANCLDMMANNIRKGKSHP